MQPFQCPRPRQKRRETWFYPGKGSRLAAANRGDGRITEWMEPYKEAEPHHRHVSHLWGLYPGDEISPETAPALAAAARMTLEARTDEGLVGRLLSRR